MGEADRIRSALHYIPANDRDTWLRMGMAVKSELGEAGFDLWNEWSQSDETYSERDAKAVWRSIDGNGKLKAGTLFREATQRGWRGNGHKPTAAELESRRIAAVERTRAAEADEAKRQGEARTRAAAILKDSQPASADYPYLKAKGVQAHGLRQHGGKLVVPMRDASGELHSLQTIAENGEKRFLPGGRKRGCYFGIGRPDGVLCIVEGYATGASVYEATGYAVAVAFDVGNLEPVAKALRAKFPELRLILCADDDAGTQGNPGLTKATEAALAVGGRLAVPDFGPDRPEGAKDFNDLTLRRGAEAVRTAIEAARAPGKAEDRPRIVALEVGELLTRDFPPMEALLTPWLRKQHLSMVYAKRGVGKTHFALGVAYAVAGGGAFLKWQADKPRKVLYIDGEMPGAAMKARVAALVSSADESKEPPQGYFRIITPDVQDGSLPDLGTEEGQSEFAPLLGDSELIVIDNLSTLLRAGAENEGESWLPMAAWALARRREGRAVLFVHHAGKGGTQRGSSRREDLLDVVINLRHPADYSPENGAQFLVRFEKSRGLYGEEVREIEATLSQGATGVQAWTWREAEGATQDRVVELAKLDMSGAEIAAELGVNKSTVSRALKKARDAGLLPAKGGHGKA